MKKMMTTAAIAAMLLGASVAMAADPVCGDVNDDGSIKTTDALLVLKKAVAQPITLDCSAFDDQFSDCESSLAACEASGGGLPKTGQTTSYGHGSDGAVRAGVRRSFTDNGDGTITDNVTGLMWEKKSDDGSIHDKDNRYTWGLDLLPYTMNGTIVTTFLATLNGGGGFAGYKDWRIPNVYELQSLVNFEVGYGGPTVFGAFNANCTGGCTVTTCSCTQTQYAHWSSTSYQSNRSGAWYVNFFDGNTFVENKEYNTFVRAVRAGS